MPTKKSKKERFNRQGRKFKVEVDTNVMSIGLKVLAENAEVASGDPVFCESCNAVFNKFSKLEENKDQQVWNWEFCEHKNEVVLDEQEIPTQESINYVLEVEENEGVEEKKVNEVNDSESPIIFCVDISGSMSQRASKNTPQNSSLQTRIDWIKSAILGQIKSMKETKRKVGLVTFSSQVNVFGDGENKVNIIGRFISDIILISF